MNLRRFVASAFVGALTFTPAAPHAEVEQANVCKAKNGYFAFLVNWLPKTLDVNTCVANNIETLSKAVAGTLFSSCSALDIHDLIRNKDLQNLVNLIKNIAAKPTEVSPLVYKYVSTQNRTSVDNLCDAFSEALGPCGEKIIPKLLPVLQKDDACCARFSDMIDLLNIIISPDTRMEYFLVNELIGGFNRFLCSNKGKSTCGLDMFTQITRLYTVKSFDFFQHMVLPFMTVGAPEECAGFAGLPYKDTASQKESSTVSYTCCIHQMRPFIQTIQKAIQRVVGDELWDILSGMVSFTAPNGSFVDSLTGTAKCKYKGDTCKDPDGMPNRIEMLRPVGAKEPGKNDLVDTECTLVNKCSGDKSVCSKVCKKGSVIVPEWLKSSLAYQRNLAFSGPFCLAQIPGSHNSAITLADGFGNRDQLFNKNLDEDKLWSYLKTNNHVLSMTDQLNMGIRFLEIDTHFFLNDLHTAHCGGLNTTSLNVFIETLGKTLGKYGAFNWASDLLGCFPSVSGIKASEQPLTKDSLLEVKAWLDANPSDFVMVYLDTGLDIKRLNKYDAIDNLLTDIFADSLVPLKAMNDLAMNEWEGGTINSWIDAGYQVLALANTETTVAFCLDSLCHVEKVFPEEFIDVLPDEKRMINGIAIYSNTNWLRSWTEQLRYISLGSTGKFTRELPVFFDAETIPKFVRWNINAICLDNADVAKMAAYVWSWAENEPSTLEDTASVFMNANGRWVTSSHAEKRSRACWDRAKLAWSIVPFEDTCPAGTTFSAPMDPYQNYLLHQELIARKTKYLSLVINATLTAEAFTPAP